MKDFFVSYNQADRDWAEWVAWILEEAGYSVVIQAWDFLPGENFVLEMSRAADETNRTIAILSENYLKAEFTNPEWAAAFSHDPQGQRRSLIPIRVQECQPKGLLGTLVYVDVVGLSVQAARDEILKVLKNEERIKPAQAPVFPGPDGTPLPIVERVAPEPVKFPGPQPDDHKSAKSFPDSLLRRWRSLSRRQAITYLVSVALIIAVAVVIAVSLVEPNKLTTTSINVAFNQSDFNKDHWVIPETADSHVNPDPSDARFYLTKAPDLIFLKLTECNYSDFMMTFDVRLTNAGGIAWAVRVRDEGNYYLFYLAGPESGRHEPGFNIYVVRNNKLDEDKLQIPPSSSRDIAKSLKEGGDYVISVTVKGNTIENSITPAGMEHDDDRAGKRVSLGIWSDQDNRFANGSIGFRTVGSEQFALTFIHAHPISDAKSGSQVPPTPSPRSLSPHAIENSLNPRCYCMSL